MKHLTLSDQHVALLKECVQLRRNLIETGNPVLSRTDMREQGREAELRPLSDDQYTLLHELARILDQLDE